MCERGQELLIRTQYLQAEATLMAAEREALAIGDWDVLARLYMPLQEARRQRRQRCGEGTICLDLISEGPNDLLEPRHVLEHYPHGQLLVAGWGTLEPARRLREMAAEHGLYVETFLAAAYSTRDGRAVLIAPTEEIPLPELRPRAIEELRSAAPAHCLVLSESDLPAGPRRGTYQTYGEVMAIWERLHAPYLAAAEREPDLLKKIEAYRQTIRIDYACEIAHQHLSDTAHHLASVAAGSS